MAREFKIPKHPAAMADLLYQTQQRRYEQQKLINQLEEQESLLKKALLETLPSSNATGVSGNDARVQIETKLVPQVKDWEAFRNYIVRENAWELLSKRVGDAAARDRWDDGEIIPGVEKLEVKWVSIHKL